MEVRITRRTVLLAAGALSAGAALPPARAGAQELTVRIGLAEGDDATPALYAIKAGLFKHYGLDVQLERMPSGAASLAALAGGSVDIGGASMLGILSARARGVPLQIVAPLAVSTPEAPYAAMLVKKDASYRTGRDLNGKTIASPALRDLNWIASMAWIDQNGGDSSTVKSLELTSSAIPAALAEGRVDASTVTTPRYVQAVNNGLARVLGHSYESIAKRFVIAAYLATVDYAAKNQQIVQRFGRSLRDASLYTNAHHAETLPIYADFAKIDPKTIADAPRAVSSEYVDAREIQPVIDVAVKYKVLAQAIDPRDLISPSILKPGAA